MPFSRLILLALISGACGQVGELEGGAFLLTAVPTAVPNPSPSLSGAAPAVFAEEATATNTLAPTVEPTASVCADGTHGCDTETTRCVSMLAEAEGIASMEAALVVSCECLAGFLPDPNDASRCLAAGTISDPTPRPVPTPLLLPTHVPTHMPTWNACTDGSHGCDLESTICVAIANGALNVTTCKCREGYSVNPSSMMECLLPTSPPTAGLLPVLWTPAPTPEAPKSKQELCDRISTNPTKMQFCSGFDRNLSLWEFPSSEDSFCEGSSVKKNVSSLKACETICGGSHALGCNYIKYDLGRRECYWSAACDTELDHLTTRDWFDWWAPKKSIYAMQCSFVRNLYETCIWAEKSWSNDYDVNHVPSDTSERGWLRLEEMVDDTKRSGSSHGPLLDGDGHISAGNSGLSLCMRECREDSNCKFFAYNDEYMDECLFVGELGEKNMDRFKQNCGYTFRRYDIDENGHPFPGASEKMHEAEEHIATLLKGFNLFMVDDATFSLYDTTAPVGQSCECKPGYEYYNETYCEPNSRGPVNSPSPYQYTEVVITGPVTTTNVGVGFVDQIAAAYLDCIVFFDCNSDGVENDGDARCLVQEGARCYVEAPIDYVDNCDATFSGLLQTNRNCHASLVTGGASQVILQVETIQYRGDIDPTVPIALEMVSKPNPCNLCGSHSCPAIDELGFTREGLTDHQSNRIAFGFDKGMQPGSAMDTVADTIG
jgi:hypothetical protein